MSAARKTDPLAGLNPEQRRAVEATEGPVLVLAGAGTGKTRVITVRIAHLVAKRVRPASILAVTFTNKAAAEMRERAAGLVGRRRARELWLGTFHSLCARVLREHGPAVGVPASYSICDAADQLTAAKKALRELHVPETKMHPRELLSRISLAKNRLLSPDRFLDEAGGDRDELVGRAWRRYDEQLARTRSLDFDDLLLKTVELLETDAGVREGLQERFRYVMVDEFQDTNAPQYEVVRRISERHGNLCVVGDDDQSIYGWRGADVSKILAFGERHPGALVVRLETNYRSTQQILTTANRIIANNPQRHEKVLRSAVGEGPPVTALSLRDEVEEADHVCREIQSLVRPPDPAEGGGPAAARLSDFAVLFRTAPQARAFEAQFRARGVPYVLIGGQSFFDRKEVRDVLAYLRLAANPLDEISFLRVVNRPSRGVGKASLDRLLAHATKCGASAPAVLGREGEVPGLSRAASAALTGFQRLMAALGARLRSTGLVEWIRTLVAEVGYRDEVERSYDDPKVVEERWNGVMEILNFAENYASRAAEPSLAGFLEELSLSANEERAEEDKSAKSAVTFMTLHAAKGLEFRRVYLVGVEEGLLPHLRSIAEDRVEEERRLAYVGVTRARYALTLTYALERSKYGRRVPCMPSRFLFELSGKPPPAGWRAAQPDSGGRRPAPRRKKKTQRRGPQKAQRKASKRRSGRG